MFNSVFFAHPTLYAHRHQCRQVARAFSSVTVSAPQRETDPKKRVVITGMGIVSVFGNDVDKFYEKLLEGESGIKLVTKFDVLKLPTRIAGIIQNFSSEGYIENEHERGLDDCWKYCLVAGKKALQSAGLGVGTAGHKKVILNFKKLLIRL